MRVATRAHDGLFMYLVRVRDIFCAAHLLTFHDGTVEPLHGHNWLVELGVACATLDETGMGVDFTGLHRLLHELLDADLDHRNLNHVAGLAVPNPTTEILARWIADRLGKPIAAMRPGVRLESVTVWETDQCGITYAVPATGDHDA